MFGFLRSGVDSLDIAFQGALNPEVIANLRADQDALKERDFQDRALITVGPGRLEAHLKESGARGGYAFVLDTGPEGATYLFKKNPDPAQWNGFVSISASGLLTRGLDGAVAMVWQALAGMGFRIADHAVNRIDYAMDFKIDRFEPNVDRFVAHSNTKTAPHYGPKTEPDSAVPQPVWRGRRLESVTVGKMPGRQLILYDKRREALQKHKAWWFKAWDIDPKAKSVEVWRIEFRAGKQELKENWRLTHLSEIREALGDMLESALTEIRYLDDRQTDGNVSRQRLHPLWCLALATVHQSPEINRCGLARGQVKEVERSQAIETYSKQIQGLSASFAAAQGWDDKTAEADLTNAVTGLVEDALADQRRPFAVRLAKAAEKRRFF